MRIKLTLERGNGRAPADLTVAVDATTPVQALADFLVQADPECDGSTAGPHTLALPDGRGEIPPDTNVGDAGIQSGVIVSLSRLGDHFRGSSPDQAVATLYVVSGPDAGREFALPAGANIIGRDPECDVQLNDPLISRRHAKVQVADLVEIHDLGSVNGILVGDTAVDKTTLRRGDTVVLGKTTIGVRHQTSAHGGTTRVPSLRFNRAPRVQPRFDGKTFALPDPPALPRGQRFPIIPLFAPLVMGAALYITTKSATSLIFMGMSPLMMVGNVAEGQLAGRRNYKRALEKFAAARDLLERDVAASLAEESRVRRDEHPALHEIAQAVRLHGPLMWSRRPDMAGFGELRLGLGQQPSRSRMEFPIGRGTDGTEKLTELHAMFDRYKVVDQVPVIAALDSCGAIGVHGPTSYARDAARALLMQLAGLHSPTELAICAVCGPDAAADWEWLKWLPHCGSTQSPIKSDPLASGRAGYLALLGETEALIRARAESGGSSGAPLPRVVLVLDNPPESERSRAVELSERGCHQGVWVIWIAPDVADLPAACKTVIATAGPTHAEAVFVDSGERVLVSAMDALDVRQADDLARRLAPVVDAASRDSLESDVPQSVSFLSLVGTELATSPESVIERWVENRSILTGPRADRQSAQGQSGNLRAVVGESASGPHVLDLRVHGPHALVGGTTGAGKSEMLQSWIIGMALSNSPQRLTFLLVDYKGGSAFSDCLHLPHTVGLVTDLSPHMVQRALTSLSAELRYREHILHRKNAKDLAALERDGDPEAPPSLVIVVDEFAALVKEVPEFVDGVVNVAQRGRSLGLHLILATQRPSGVIRDNLRANTNLRIALRMADVADSTDVIGSKMAAAFDPGIPGRAASRTGPTALVPFQTGYVGGWTSAMPSRPVISASTFGFAAKATWDLPPEESAATPAEGPTDIQRLVATISSAHRAAELATPRKPWLSELAAAYDLAGLPSRRRDNELVFAVADDPANQAQPTMSFRPDDDGNMAIFGTGNAGKSTMLRTLCVAAGYTVRGGPCHVYGLDFAARGLQMLEQLPHVGSVIAGTDTERVSRLLRIIRETIDARAAKFAEVGAGSITQYRQISGHADEPRILLLVDGMGAMRTAYEGTEHHRLFESFLSIAADGRQVGIHVILTADRAGAIPSALNALIQRRVVLRMAGENDYAMLGQPVDVISPKAPPGRGLCDDLEIQVAVLSGSPDILDQDLATRLFAQAMERAGVAPAPPVGKLEEEVTLDALPVEADGRPVFAVAAETLSEIGFEVSGTFTLVGPPGSGRTTTLATMATSINRWRPPTQLIYFGSRRSPLAALGVWTRTALNVAEAAQLATEVPDLLGELTDGGATGAVFIENLVDYVQSAADAPLQEMIKQLVAIGHLVVSDGEAMPLSGLQPLIQAARSSRVGLALQPELTDATLFRAQFPRLRKADLPPGRGLYMARGRQPALVHVAVAGSPPH